MIRGVCCLAIAAVLLPPGGPEPPLRPCIETTRQSATPDTIPSTAAYLVVDIASGRRLHVAREDRLRAPVLPGSILKIATLIAALDSGVIEAGTRIACQRRLDVDGRHFTCSHPDVGHPLGPAEALAHSCNYFFASVASRIRRDALDRAMVLLGLPPSTSSSRLVSAALGVEGARITPEDLLAAFVRLTTGSSRLAPGTRDILLQGLRGAADYGTAHAFHERGVSALAKTGTAPMDGGGYQGLVVAVTPSEHPAQAVVVIVPGAAGMDAALIAAKLVAGRTVRVGHARPDGGFDVERIPLEEYVGRVVSGEVGGRAGDEAEKAVAIVARTFALVNQGRHAAEGFDLCDLTHCQVMGRASVRGVAAARATEGQVVLFGGQPAPVFYTASCGGYSEKPSRVWPKAVDQGYLVSRPEPGCARSSAWQSDVSAQSLERALRVAGLRGGALRDLRVLERSESGRVIRVQVDGFSPPALGGEEFRLAVGRSLGWQHLKSTLFDVRRTAAGYRFDGRGSGHGVGLCVTGASRRARAGQRASAILRAYLPGTTIGTIDQVPPVGSRLSARLKVALPAGEEAERARVEDLSRDALREIATRSGLALPEAVEIVYHATVDAYRRATGQPWWTAAATRGARVDLIPPSVLRERGLLESTLRHELAHVVIAERLAGRPLWVREGAAMYLAGGYRGEPVPGKAVCPSDVDWKAIRTRDGLERAYVQAAACFNAEIAAGRRWDEVR
ncbi:MAG TPA: SpoIID/LytB domain-containing protein [Vicinamibacterales bacterium]|jgi:stage II sporulation protein D